VPVLSWLLFQSNTGIAISDGYKLYVENLIQAANHVNLEGMDSMLKFCYYPVKNISFKVESIP
jgi:hypothetical protein